MNAPRQDLLGADLPELSRWDILAKFSELHLNAGQALRFLVPGLGLPLAGVVALRD